MPRPRTLADAPFAFPSTKEGFGLAAMEALAAGVPLVARDLPVLQEVFEGAALLASGPAQLAREIERAVLVEDQARQHRGSALAHAHTWAAAASRHIELYSRLSARTATD